MSSRSTLSPRSPADAGWTLEGELPALGRARRRVAHRAAKRGEILELGAEDVGLAGKLLESGLAGVFGFVDGGRDGGGAWLARALPGGTLADTLRARRERWPHREATALAEHLATALEACERQALSPGALTPDAIRLTDEGRPVIVAEELLAARLGARVGAAPRDATSAPLWTPPAQLEGAPWDGAANRWALGLILYRTLSGEHPFAGAGLRHALAEAAHREAPPFDDAVVRELPAGLQSLVLKLLHPDAERRPATARAVRESLRSLGRDDLPREDDRRPAPRASAAPSERTPARTARERRSREPVAPRPDARAEPRPPKPTRSAARATRGAARPPRSAARLAAAVPLGVGALVAAVAVGLAAGGGPAAPSGTAPRGSAPAALTFARPLQSQETTAQDCASCHPRQSAEWRRSVMAHSVKSPLFNSLEAVVEEQVGRDEDCPNGAGILRRTSPGAACRDSRTGVVVSGAGGEHWCVNCHSPGEAQVEQRMPIWEGRAGGDPRSRLPVRDLLGERGAEGISCGFCHQVHGPVGRGSATSAAFAPGGTYLGNPGWTSTTTGATFAARPEDGRGLLGIANSGALMRPDTLLAARPIADAPGDPSPPRVHLRPDKATKSYLQSSEFCGSCHDVRLFGTDVIGARQGEHFKRLRNAYSEWDDWARAEQRAGRDAASCQDCHMSTFPGVCEADAGSPGGGGCPPGTRFSKRAPGSRVEGFAAVSSTTTTPVAPHWFSGVDLPLSREYPDDLIREAALDASGVPLSPRGRRDQLLQATFKFAIATARRTGTRIEVPVELTNVGAGHRVPAGFSQEREIWVHLHITGQGGRTVYEVGRVDRGDQDLKDKLFVRVNTDPDRLDARGRPEGLFGADLRDGPDVPRWSPPPDLGGTSFRGEGLVNLQNGFLRCVRCIGVIDGEGRCQPGPGQGLFRADRFDDGDYDQDTGECRSNLTGNNALFETFFPVGALDASRGIAKAPDAIIDTRSAPPGVALRYTYDLSTRGVPGPYRAEARLLFRAFPPFFIRAFAGYERAQAARGRRPSGPLVDEGMLSRLEVVELGRAEAEIR